MRLKPYQGDAPVETEVEGDFDALLGRADLRSKVAEVERGAVRKYNEAQDRDDHGRWTSSASVADLSRHATHTRPDHGWMAG